MTTPYKKAEFLRTEICEDCGAKVGIWKSGKTGKEYKTNTKKSNDFHSSKCKPIKGKPDYKGVRTAMYLEDRVKRLETDVDNLIKRVEELEETKTQEDDEW